MESQTFECPTCLISLAGLDNFQKHVNSLEHALMVKLKACGNITDEDKIGEQCQPLQSSHAHSGKLVDTSSGMSSCFQCKICQKIFSGTVPYQQHLESALHLKNTGMPINSSQSFKSVSLKCEVCDKAFSGSVPYDQHMVSNVHKKKVFAKQLLEKTEIASAFSGIDHGTNCESNANYENSVQSSPLQQSTVGVLKCDICDKSFSGVIPFDQHQNSSVHKKKVVQKELMMKESDKLFSIPDFSTTGKSNAPTSISQNVESNESESAEPIKSIQLNRVPNDLLGLSCEICDKQFSGPVPFEQHMTSNVHKKKVFEKELIKMHQDKKLLASSEPVINTSIQSIDSDIISNMQSSIGNVLQCEICDKHFSGPIPFEMHVSSNVHKKKVLDKEAIKNMNRGDLIQVPDSSTKDKVVLSQTNPLFSTLPKDSEGNGLSSGKHWYCQICKKQCTGVIPYNQHIASEIHCKNVRLIEIKDNFKKLTDCNSVLPPSTSAESNQSENLNSVSKDNCLVSQDASETPGINRIYQENTDFILEDLNFITPENLNITIFRQDENIRFDAVLKS